LSLFFLLVSFSRHSLLLVSIEKRKSEKPETIFVTFVRRPWPPSVRSCTLSLCYRMLQICLCLCDQWCSFPQFFPQICKFPSLFLCPLACLILVTLICCWLVFLCKLIFLSSLELKLYVNWNMIKFLKWKKNNISNIYFYPNERIKWND
jgi:hypothetical protein